MYKLMEIKSYKLFVLYSERQIWKIYKNINDNGVIVENNDNKKIDKKFSQRFSWNI